MNAQRHDIRHVVSDAPRVMVVDGSKLVRKLIGDVLAKSLGSDNAINVVHATVAALKLLQRPEEVAARRGLPIEDVAPAGMLRARREAEAAAVGAAREGTA